MPEITQEQAKELVLNRTQNLQEQQPQAEVKIEPQAQITSLGKVNLDRPTSDVPGLGWKVLTLGNLPSRGIFYPEDAKIQIRAAYAKEIKHFSTIEEEDVLDADDKLNYILENCATFSSSSIENRFNSFRDLLEVDRFFIILCIRDLTFKEGENKLQMSVNCNACGNNDMIELKNVSLNLFELDPRLEKYFNPETKCFNIRTKDGETWDIYLPTLGVSNFIKNYTRALIQKNRGSTPPIDRFFLKFGSFLFPDWRTMTEKTYKSAQDDTNGWNTKKISIMDSIVDLLQNSVNTDIVHNCKVCGTEIKQPLSFQGGFKSLFLYTDILSELD